MARKSKAAVNVEYFALRFFCGVVNLVPYRIAMALAAALAWTAFHVLRLKRARTMERLREVFPEKPESELRDIAWRSFANILETGVEMMRAPRLTREWMDRYVVDGRLYKDRLQKYVDEGRGVVIMVPHSGNWYMAAWAMAKYGLPLFAIAAKQRNPKIDAWMKRQYGDIEVLDRGSMKTLVEIRKRLEAGRAFAILPDLRVPQPDVEVDFFGGRANVSHAGAMFAVRSGSPIVVAVMRRERGRHVFDHVATLRPDMSGTDRKAEAARLTREVMRLLDERIRRYPEHWFWYNKRWILQPVGGRSSSRRKVSLAESGRCVVESPKTAREAADGSPGRNTQEGNKS
ncbi:MAG: lysophospholipid acyltransferase family protein [Kiritimatiellae bacterium]|nr:lysophospholipid acyltransferase family protein [Kiritimatiellia bacterium]